MLLLLLQLVVILAVARACASLFARIGQPPVVGEMFAGIMLGPSLFGALAPVTAAALFPPTSLSPLSTVSQIAVVIFMFGVGTELDVSRLRSHATAAIAISQAGIVVPLLLGTALGSALHGAYAPAGVGRWTFALFIGVAMSITAFPVLARIVADRGLTRDPIGQLALTSAALADASAWCLLTASVVLAGMTSLASGSRSLLYIFGAFVAGALCGVNRRLHDAIAPVLERVERVALVPVFFAFAGLRTDVRALSTPAEWTACAAIVLVAVGGKVGACSVAARLSGIEWRGALTVGILMNTRGLMELIVLNIGYDLGILTPNVFTMFVLMALVTTAMTGPLVGRTHRIPA